MVLSSPPITFIVDCALSNFTLVLFSSFSACESLLLNLGTSIASSSSVLDLLFLGSSLTDSAGAPSWSKPLLPFSVCVAMSSICLISSLLASLAPSSCSANCAFSRLTTSKEAEVAWGEECR